MEQVSVRCIQVSVRCIQGYSNITVKFRPSREVLVQLITIKSIHVQVRVLHKKFIKILHRVLYMKQEIEVYEGKVSIKFLLHNRKTARKYDLISHLIDSFSEDDLQPHFTLLF